MKIKVSILYQSSWKNVTSTFLVESSGALQNPKVHLQITNCIIIKKLKCTSLHWNLKKAIILKYNTLILLHDMTLTISLQNSTDIEILYALIVYWVKITEGTLKYFSYFFPENRFWHFNKVSPNLHKMSNPFLRENSENIIVVLSAELAQKGGKV